MDNVIWDGILTEEEVKPNDDILAIIKELDSKGILHSISSKNNWNEAYQKLSDLKIKDYFLYPQICWQAKSKSIKKISEELNINLDSIAFVDDSLFEQDEVKFALPQVRCYSPEEINNLCTTIEEQTNYITEESKNRRNIYKADYCRKQAEAKFEGPKEEFLASIKMKITIRLMTKNDLARAEELTVRTHQLNTTGKSYSSKKLSEFINRKDYKLFIVELNDKYGSYGKIGLAIVHCKPSAWNIKLLLMSCRVMSKGVGTVLLTHIINYSLKEKVNLYADFIHNNKNRMMYVTYKFMGFKEIKTYKNKSKLKYLNSKILKYPRYVKVVEKTEVKFENNFSNSKFCALINKVSNFGFIRNREKHYGLLRKVW